MRIEILACLGFMLVVGCPVSDVLKAAAAVFSGYYIGTGMNQQPRVILPFLTGIAFVAGSVVAQSPHGFAAAYYLPYGTPALMAMWWKLCSLMANSQALGAAARYGLLTVPAEAVHGFFGLVRAFLVLVAAGAMFVVDAGRRRLAAPLLAAAAVGGHGNQEEDEEGDIDAESADDDDVAARDNFEFVRPPVAHRWAGFARLPVLGNNYHHNGVGEDVGIEEEEDVYEDAADNGDDEEDEYVESYEDYNYIYSDEDDEEENVVDEVASNAVVVEEVTSNDVVAEEVNWIDVVVDEVTSSDVLQDGTRGASGEAVYRNASNNNSAISSSQSTVAAAYNPALPMRSNNWSLSSNSNNSVPRLGSLTGNYNTVNSAQVVAHSHALAAAPAAAANASSAFNTQVVAQSHALAAAANASANRFLPPLGAEPQQLQPRSINQGLGLDAANASANRFLPPLGAEPQQLQPSSINQGLGLDAANASANRFLPPLGADQQRSLSSHGIDLDAANDAANASANRFLPPFGAEQQRSNISNGLGLDAAASATDISNVSAGGAEPTINDDELPVRTINLQPATFVYNWGDPLFSNSNDNGLGSAQSPAAAAVDSFSSAPATLLPDGEKQGDIGPLVDDTPNPRKRKTRPEASTASSNSNKGAKSKVPEDEDDDDEATLEPPAKRHCPSTRFRDSPTLTQISDVTSTDEDSAIAITPASSTATHKDGGALLAELSSPGQNQEEEEPASSSETPAAEKPTKFAAKKTAAKKPAAKKPVAKKAAPKKASKPAAKAPKPFKAPAKQVPAAKKSGIEAVVDEAAKVPALRRSTRSSRRV